MLGVFEIHEPSSVLEASQMLAHYGEDATVYAGGTELLLVMKEGLAHYSQLINIKTIQDLDRIRLNEEDGYIGIGATVTHHQLDHQPIIRRYIPVLSEVVTQIANIRIQNVGTIGGNLCFAEPHSDPITLFLALGARIVLNSEKGERILIIDDFIGGMFETARGHEEVLLEIRVPRPKASSGTSYERFTTYQRPTATAAVSIDLKDNLIRDARVAVGGVTPWPRRIVRAEKLLISESPSEEIFDEAAEKVADDVEPVSDFYGSAEYKLHLIRIMLRRALENATNKALEESV